MLVWYITDIREIPDATTRGIGDNYEKAIRRKVKFHLAESKIHYNHVIKKVHECTMRGTTMYFFVYISIFNFQLKLRFANRLKYQPHLIAGEVARSAGVARAL